MKITSGCKIYATRLFDWIQPSPRLHGEFFLPSCREESKECREGTAEGDLEERRGAEEVLTWVENLHGGVGVRMLFMDHLSADLLCEDLPGDRNGITAINDFSNNRETEEYENLRC